MYRARIILFTFAVAGAVHLAGCGGSPNAAPDAGRDAAEAGGPDASPDAFIPYDDLGPPPETLFAVAGDYSSTGVFSTIDIPGLAVTQNALAGVASADPVLRGDLGGLYINLGGLYIVNRQGGDNVTILNTSPLSLVAQISTGAASDPQDVAPVGNKLYVAALAAKGVLVLDTTQPNAGVIKTIDLSSLDPDGKPDCNSIYAVGTKVYVACGILDDSKSNLPPRGPGKIAVIDTTTDKVTTTFELTHNNPFGMLRQLHGGPHDGDLIDTTVPSFQDLTKGCLELINTGATPGSDGCLVQNSDLGGYPSGYAPEAGGGVWAAVTTSFDSMDYKPHGKVVEITADGTVGAPISMSGERPFDVVLCPSYGLLVTADAAGGMRVYNPADGSELTSDPLDIGLPPVPNGIACPF